MRQWSGSGHQACLAAGAEPGSSLGIAVEAGKTGVADSKAGPKILPIILAADCFLPNFFLFPTSPGASLGPTFTMMTNILL